MLLSREVFFWPGDCIIYDGTLEIHCPPRKGVGVHPRLALGLIIILIFRVDVGKLWDGKVSRFIINGHDDHDGGQ